MTGRPGNASTDAVRRPAAKTFSVAEANRALVLVSRIVEDIVADYGRLTEMQEWMDLAASQGAYDRTRVARSELLRLAERIWNFLEELDEIGVELKDSSAGVVDFPSMMHGREIRLCWRHGEARVEHWHEPNAEFAGRHPLEPDPAGGTYASEPAQRALAQ